LRDFLTVPPIDWTLFDVVVNYLFYLRVAFLAVEFSKLGFQRYGEALKRREISG